MFRRLLAVVLFATFAVNQARADLVLNIAGVTDVGSSLAGNPISPGTSFEVQATFPDTPYGTATGVGSYPVTSITAVVGGTSYSVLSLSNFYVELIDPAYGYGFQYVSILENTSEAEAFEPEYTTATPALDATAATPTVFSGYYGSDNSQGSTSLSMSTAAGELTLNYNAVAGVSSSITNANSAVPEPSSLHLAVMGGLAGVGIALIRRRRAVAVA